MAKYLVVFSLLIASTLAASVKQHNIDPTGSWKIVGGSEAEEGQYPYQVSLRDTYGFHLCGGSIISNEWILSAAHCVEGYEPRKLIIVAGTNHIHFGGDTYKVVEIRAHEDFDMWELNDDIALLKVEPITFNAKVLPIALETDDVGDAVDCVLTGWGVTSYPEDGSSPKLQHIALKTITNEKCREMQGYQITGNQVCTLTKRDEGACYGDSGGPLARVVDGVPKVFGIVSWGMPCAVGYPDVFTRVSVYLSWINDIINPASN